MSKLGIDISSYQTNVNYDKVIKNGIEFAILRVGYGVSYLPDSQRDKQFDNHYNGLKGKIPLGAYYYSYAKKIGDGRKEAENCLKYINGKSFEYPIFYDLEDKTSQGLSTKDLTEIALEFVSSGKLSPWLLFSGIANSLLERMSDSQLDRLTYDLKYSNYTYVQLSKIYNISIDNLNLIY